MKSYYLLLLIICFISCNEKKTDSNSNERLELVPKPDENPVLSEGEVIALKNGVLEWDNVQQIDFTFNVDRIGKNVAKRSWSWKPKTNDVTMISATDTITYNRSSIDSTSMRADQGFINDKFWLLAPYQIAWDKGTTIKIEDSVMSPMSQKISTKLTTVYGNDGGYTPGDAYDFYYGEDYKITEWVFRKGNDPEPSMMTTFESYHTYRGLNIATEHKDKGDSLNIYFTNIKVIK